MFKRDLCLRSFSLTLVWRSRDSICEWATPFRCPGAQCLAGPAAAEAVSTGLKAMQQHDQPIKQRPLFDRR